jgi:hypothetical protein
MRSSKGRVYVRKTSREGLEILCPVDDVNDTKTVVEEDTEHCVEKNVVGRYAGYIEVRSDFPS